MGHTTRYLLSELPGPVDVVAPGDDDGKLEKDKQNSIQHGLNLDYWISGL